MIKIKQIEGLSNYLQTDWKYAEGEFEKIEDGLPGSSTPNIELSNIITALFPDLAGENYPDRYITGELELFFACNHRYKKLEEEPQIDTQWSVTANKVLRFSVLENYATTYNGMRYSYNSTLNQISHTGRYTIYNTFNGIHNIVESVGDLHPSAYSVSISPYGTNNANLGIYVSANLRSLFNTNTDYLSKILWKLKLYNWDIETFSFHDGDRDK